MLNKYIVAKMKIPLRTRFKLAWYAFWLKEYKERLMPIHFIDHIQKKSWNICDNERRISKCQNIATQCVSDIWVEMKIDHSDHMHYHVCDLCAAKAIASDKTE